MIIYHKTLRQIAQLSAQHIHGIAGVDSTASSRFQVACFRCKFCQPKDFGIGEMRAKLHEQAYECCSLFQVTGFMFQGTVVLDANTALTEALAFSRFQVSGFTFQETAGPANVNEFEDFACTVGDVVVSEVINTDIRRLTTRSRWY